MGLGDFFSRLREGLARTNESLVVRVQEILATRTTLDEATVTRIEETLLTADVGVTTTAAIIDRLRREVKEHGVVRPEDTVRLLCEEIERVLSGSASPGEPGILPDQPRPYVIMVVGVNGAGKTTTVGKLAHVFHRSGLSVLVGAADTFRAAANEQLDVWANRAGADIIRQSSGADPASVVFDTVSAAAARGTDVVLLDTAGRLHTKAHLMEELRKIRRAAGKRLEGSPHEVLLVLDATTGQNGLQQAMKFGEAADVTGLVLTKLDGTAKGGVVLAIAAERKLPVRFVGFGEGIDDLQPFEPHTFARALLGMPAEEH